MRKIIEYTLVSVDGVFAGAGISGFFEYRDDAYIRDGLGQLLTCDAMLKPGRKRRHGEPRIIAQQCHQPGYIRLLPQGHITVKEVL